LVCPWLLRTLLWFPNNVSEYRYLIAIKNERYKVFKIQDLSYCPNVTNFVYNVASS
jgi:hypothetical protein